MRETYKCHEIRVTSSVGAWARRTQPGPSALVRGVRRWPGPTPGDRRSHPRVPPLVSGPCPGRFPNPRSAATRTPGKPGPGMSLQGWHLSRASGALFSRGAGGISREGSTHPTERSAASPPLLCISKANFGRTSPEAAAPTGFARVVVPLQLRVCALLAARSRVVQGGICALLEHPGCAGQRAQQQHQGQQQRGNQGPERCGPGHGGAGSTRRGRCTGAPGGGGSTLKRGCRARLARGGKSASRHSRRGAGAAALSDSPSGRGCGGGNGGGGGGAVAAPPLPSPPGWTARPSPGAPHGQSLARPRRGPSSSRHLRAFGGRERGEGAGRGPGTGGAHPA